MEDIKKWNNLTKRKISGMEIRTMIRCETEKNHANNKYVNLWDIAVASYSSILL